MDSGYQGGMSFAWPRLTPAVKVLLIVNGVVFGLNAVTFNHLNSYLRVSWDGLWEGYGLGLLRPLTYQFAHSFTDPFHLLFNMLALYFFGTFVEAAIGTKRLYSLYVIGGLVGGVMHVLLGRITGHDAPAVGASGSIFAILVYAAFMAPRMRVLLIVFPIEMRWLVGFLVGYGVYMTYLAIAVGLTDGTAHGGHLGGALWGFLAFRLPAGGGAEWRWVARLRQWRHERERQAGRLRQEVLDQLLDKVHREGIQSLTAAERRFLDQTSRKMRGK